MKYSFYILPLVLLITQCRQKEENYITQFPGKPGTPSSVQKEHEYLLDLVHKMTLSQDSAGRAAIKLDDLMQHHFKEEEDYVLPPLDLLPLLASGEIPRQSKEVIQLSDKLKTQLSHLNAEHQLIKAYLDELKKAGANGSHPEIFEFEKELQKHAEIEEEVLFPAAILVGEYLKLKSGS